MLGLPLPFSAASKVVAHSGTLVNFKEPLAVNPRSLSLSATTKLSTNQQPECELKKTCFSFLCLMTSWFCEGLPIRVLM